ncbi:hypothetical protein NAF19_24665 [Mucilaginibacter sp. RT5R15]|nr:hypothetical protein [Mucilaginibacter flavidus]
MLLPVFCCFAQQVTEPVNGHTLADTSAARLKDCLTAYFKKYPSEKVFVHTNQDVYTSGETIWYKVYAMAYGKPTALSHIVYLQLTDTAGNVIMQNKLHITNGTAHGNLDINQQLKSGWYRLSAFTAWMMNFDRDGYYQQKIFIKNLADSTSIQVKKTAAKKTLHLDFYPEGGEIIDDNMSNIAFRAYDSDGVAVNVAGVVTDNTGTTVAQFNTVHDGMGQFAINAFANSTYTASVQFADGSTQQFELPPIKENGICLRASQNESTVALKIAYVGAHLKFANCVLVAFQNNGAVSSYPLKLKRGANLFNLPKAGFVTGILRLTVFDGDKIPCAERIVFINKHDIQPTAIKPDTLSFAPGAYNSFSTALKDENGQPINGSFSVSVTDAGAFDKTAAGQNIFSALLLSPELNGEVNTPGYYFKNTSDSLARQLDLVMLTRGWRHFVWQKILSGSSEAIKYPVENSQYVAGKITGYKSPGGLKDKSQVKILVMNQDSSKFIGYVTPDSSGSFIIKDFNHAGLSDVYLQSTDKKNQPEKLTGKLFGNISDSLKRAKTDGFAPEVPPGISSYYIAGSKADENTRFKNNVIILKTVKIKSTKTTPTEKLVDDHVSPLFHSNREFTLDLVNNPTLNIGLVNYIRGRFPGLQIIGDNTQTVFLYRGGNSLPKPNKPADVTESTGMQAEMGIGADKSQLPYFYLNEVPVDFTAVKDINLEEVAMIRFLPPPVSFAPFNGGNAGTMMIYTKKQADEIKAMKGMAGYDHFIFNGYSVSREFSAPDYSKSGFGKTTDSRAALYWNHDIGTNSSGVLKFRFYNSGRANKFRIILQGMDTEGRLFYAEQVF